MAIAAQASIEDYLSTTYRPDCDYVDGEIQERNVGKFDHSDLQGELITYFRNRQREWNIRALPEQRLRVSPTRVRIPDVCILSREQPIEQIFTRPPLICIEILSEGDTLNSTRPRLTDYANFGVAHIWTFDPELRLAWIWHSETFIEVTETLSVANSPIRLDLPTLFAPSD